MSLASQEIPHHLMEPQGPLLHSQTPDTCPYPEPEQTSLYISIHSHSTS